MPTRVGIDLTSIGQVRASMAAHNRRYLDRIYTSDEVRDCSGDHGVDPERLAARFAAKEAAIKVLRPGPAGLPWKSIAVRRDAGGWVELELDGPAAALADASGVKDLTLSLTHEGEFAAAVVVANMENTE